MSFNNKGITLIESLIAVMLTAIAIVGLLTMQPMGWKSAGHADSISHATQIMQRELERIELSLMCDIDTVPTVNTSATVSNETFTITTTIGSLTNGTRLVNVRVTWPRNATTGVSSSMIVSSQEIICP